MAPWIAKQLQRGRPRLLSWTCYFACYNREIRHDLPSRRLPTLPQICVEA